MMNHLVHLLVIVIINTTITTNSAASRNLMNNTDNKSETNVICNTSIEEARKKEEKDLMSKMLPMMVIPFLVSSGMIPMSLISLKFMLVQSMFIGKVAVLLLLISMFRSRNSNNGGVYSHNINDGQIMAHYGYNGGEEYGAYVNKRKKRQFIL